MCILLCLGMMGGGGGGRKADTKPERRKRRRGEGGGGEGGEGGGGGGGGGGGTTWPPGPKPPPPPPAPYFTISVSPRSRTVSPGGSATYTIRLTSHRGFSETVSLSLERLPAGCAHMFSPRTVTLTPGGSRRLRLAVSTSSRTPTGTYDLAIIGTSRTRGQVASIRLTVK